MTAPARQALGLVKIRLSGDPADLEDLAHVLAGGGVRAGEAIEVIEESALYANRREPGWLLPDRARHQGRPAMKPADAYEAVDHTDVLQIKARHWQPCTDDVVLSVVHRTTGAGRSVLLTRQQATELRDWLARWVEEGWDGVPRRCPAACTPGDRWLFECDQPAGHPGPHEGPAARWPSGQVRERMCWS